MCPCGYNLFLFFYPQTYRLKETSQCSKERLGKQCTLNEFLCQAWTVFSVCVCVCMFACVYGYDEKAAGYSTSHSECWKSRAGAAGRRRDRQLFPPHISVQRRHQSLAEMSVLQAGDRPLNVSPSQVNTESQPAASRQKGGRGVHKDKKRKPQGQ